MQVFIDKAALSGYNNEVRSRFTIFDANVAHLVERHLAKVEVAGSIPVVRSRDEFVLLRCLRSRFCVRVQTVWNLSKNSVCKQDSWHRIYLSDDGKFLQVALKFVQIIVDFLIRIRYHKFVVSMSYHEL